MVQNGIRTIATAIGLGVSAEAKGEVAWENDELRPLRDLVSGDDAEPVGGVVRYLELGVDEAALPPHPLDEVGRLGNDARRRRSGARQRAAVGEGGCRRGHEVDGRG